ncbi:FHA domain-containing protein, partial [Candidatus Omnitrophota bacterium]
MRLITLAKKTVSTILALSIIASNCYGYEVSNPSLFKNKSHAQRYLKSKEKKSLADKIDSLSDLCVPDELGRVIDSFKGATDKVVIHIQDRHIDPVAQFNISKTLDNLISRHNIKLLCLEGGSDELDTTFYDNIPDDDPKKRVSEFFVKQGIFTGAEYFKIVNKDIYLRAVGVEDNETYFQHIATYKKTRADKENILAMLNAIDKALSEIKRKTYTKDLKFLDKLSRSYISKQIQLSDYVKSLAKYAKRKKLDVSKYEDFYKFSALLEKETKIDFKKAEEEREKLIKQLSDSLDKEQLTTLLQKSLDYRLSKISALEFYTYLESISQVSGNWLLVTRDYDNLALYIEYLKLSHDINHLNVFDETDLVGEEVKIALCESETQKELVLFSKAVVMLQDLYHLRLTRKKLEYLNHRDEHFDIGRIVTFTKDLSARYGLNVPLAISATTLNQQAISNSKEFYELALKRDLSLVGNTLTSMKLYKKDKAILITGGFHTQGITEILKREGVSYLVICPNVGMDDCEPIYEARMEQRIPDIGHLTTLFAQTLGMPLVTAKASSAGLSELAQKAFANLRNIVLKEITKSFDSQKGDQFPTNEEFRGEIKVRAGNTPYKITVQDRRAVVGKIDEATGKEIAEYTASFALGPNKRHVVGFTDPGHPRKGLHDRYQVETPYFEFMIYPSITGSMRFTLRRPSPETLSKAPSALPSDSRIQAQWQAPKALAKSSSAGEDDAIEMDDVVKAAEKMKVAFERDDQAAATSLAAAVLRLGAEALKDCNPGYLPLMAGILHYIPATNIERCDINTVNRFGKIWHKRLHDAMKLKYDNRIMSPREKLQGLGDYMYDGFIYNTFNAGDCFFVVAGAKEGDPRYRVRRNVKFFDSVIRYSTIDLYMSRLENILIERPYLGEFLAQQQKQQGQRSSFGLDALSDLQEFLDKNARQEKSLPHNEQLSRMAQSAQETTRFITDYLEEAYRQTLDATKYRSAALQQQRDNIGHTKLKELAYATPKRVVIRTKALKDDWNDPDVMIIDERGYWVTEEDVELGMGHKLLIARWKSKIFLFVSSLSLPNKKKLQHQWRNCNGIEGSTLLTSTPANLDHIHGKLALRLDRIAISEGVSFEQISDAHLASLATGNENVDGLNDCLSGAGEYYQLAARIVAVSKVLNPGEVEPDIPMLGNVAISAGDKTHRIGVKDGEVKFAEASKPGAEQITCDTLRPYSVGKDSGCDYSTPDGSGLSGRHFRFIVREDKHGQRFVTIQDTDSTNGTRVYWYSLQYPLSKSSSAGDIFLLAADTESRFIGEYIPHLGSDYNVYLKNTATDKIVSQPIAIERLPEYKFERARQERTAFAHSLGELEEGVEFILAQSADGYLWVEKRSVSEIRAGSSFTLKQGFLFKRKTRFTVVGILGDVFTVQSERGKRKMMKRHQIERAIAQERGLITLHTTTSLVALDRIFLSGMFVSSRVGTRINDRMIEELTDRPQTRPMRSVTPLDRELMKTHKSWFRLWGSIKRPSALSFLERIFLNYGNKPELTLIFEETAQSVSRPSMWKRWFFQPNAVFVPNKPQKSVAAIKAIIPHTEAANRALRTHVQIRRVIKENGITIAPRVKRLGEDTNLEGAVFFLLRSTAHAILMATSMILNFIGYEIPVVIDEMLVPVFIITAISHIGIIDVPTMLARRRAHELVKETKKRQEEIETDLSFTRQEDSLQFLGQPSTKSSSAGTYMEELLDNMPTHLRRELPNSQERFFSNKENLAWLDPAGGPQVLVYGKGYDTLDRALIFDELVKYFDGNEGHFQISNYSIESANCPHPDFGYKLRIVAVDEEDVQGVLKRSLGYLTRKRIGGKNIKFKCVINYDEFHKLGFTSPPLPTDKWSDKNMPSGKLITVYPPGDSIEEQARNAAIIAHEMDELLSGYPIEYDATQRVLIKGKIKRWAPADKPFSKSKSNRVMWRYGAYSPAGERGIVLPDESRSSKLFRRYFPRKDNRLDPDFGGKVPPLREWLDETAADMDFLASSYQHDPVSTYSVQTKEKEDRLVNGRIEFPGVPHGKGRLMVVIDGHGGKEAAEMIEDNLQEYFKRAMASELGDVSKALKSMFAALRELVKDEGSGATLAVVYIPNDQMKAYVGVLGSTYVVIKDANGNVNYGPDHRPKYNLAEREDAIARGAAYDEESGSIIPSEPQVRGLVGGINTSRSLGDSDLGDIVSREPDIYSLPLSEEGFAAILSDALLEKIHSPLSEGEVAHQRQLDFVSRLAVRENAAEKLVSQGLRSGAKEDCTAIVWNAKSSSAGADIFDDQARLDTLVPTLSNGLASLFAVDGNSGFLHNPNAELKVNEHEVEHVAGLILASHDNKVSRADSVTIFLDVDQSKARGIFIETQQFSLEPLPDSGVALQNAEVMVPDQDDPNRSWGVPLAQFIGDYIDGHNLLSHSVDWTNKADWSTEYGFVIYVDKDSNARLPKYTGNKRYFVVGGDGRVTKKSNIILSVPHPEEGQRLELKLHTHGIFSDEYFIGPSDYDLMSQMNRALQLAETNRDDFMGVCLIEMILSEIPDEQRFELFAVVIKIEGPTLEEAAVEQYVMEYGESGWARLSTIEVADELSEGLGYPISGLDYNEFKILVEKDQEESAVIAEDTATQEDTDEANPPIFIFDRGVVEVKFLPKPDQEPLSAEAKASSAGVIDIARLTQDLGSSEVERRIRAIRDIKEFNKAANREKRTKVLSQLCKAATLPQLQHARDPILDLIYSMIEEKIIRASDFSSQALQSFERLAVAQRTREVDYYITLAKILVHIAASKDKGLSARAQKVIKDQIMPSFNRAILKAEDNSPLLDELKDCYSLFLSVKGFEKAVIYSLLGIAQCDNARNMLIELAAEHKRLPQLIETIDFYLSDRINITISSRIRSWSKIVITLSDLMLSGKVDRSTHKKARKSLDRLVITLDKIIRDPQKKDLLIDAVAVFTFLYTWYIDVARTNNVQALGREAEEIFEVLFNDLFKIARDANLLNNYESRIWKINSGYGPPQSIATANYLAHYISRNPVARRMGFDRNVFSVLIQALEEPDANVSMGAVVGLGALDESIKSAMRSDSIVTTGGIAIDSRLIDVAYELGKHLSDTYYWRRSAFDYHEVAYFPKLFSMEIFTEAINDLTDAQALSSALDIIRFLEKRGKRDLNQEDARLALNEISETRIDYMTHPLLRSGLSLVSLTNDERASDGSDMFIDEPIIESAKKAGIGDQEIYRLRGAGAKIATRDLVSRYRPDRTGTTFWFNGHALSDRLEVSSDPENPVYITYQEFGKALLKYQEAIISNGDQNSRSIGEVNIVLDCCYGYDFAMNLNQYLQDNGALSLPVIVTASNRAQVSYSALDIRGRSYFTNAISRVMVDKLTAKPAWKSDDPLPLFLSDISQVEKYLDLEDSAVLVPSLDNALDYTEIYYDGAQIPGGPDYDLADEIANEGLKHFADILEGVVVEDGKIVELPSLIGNVTIEMKTLDKPVDKGLNRLTIDPEKLLKQREQFISGLDDKQIAELVSLMLLHEVIAAAAGEKEDFTAHAAAMIAEARVIERLSSESQVAIRGLWANREDKRSAFGDPDEFGNLAAKASSAGTEKRSGKSTRSLKRRLVLAFLAASMMPPQIGCTLVPRFAGILQEVSLPRLPNRMRKLHEQACETSDASAVNALKDIALGKDQAKAKKAIEWLGKIFHRSVRYTKVDAHDLTKDALVNIAISRPHLRAQVLEIVRDALVAAENLEMNAYMAVAQIPGIIVEKDQSEKSVQEIIDFCKTNLSFKLPKHACCKLVESYVKAIKRGVQYVNTANIAVLDEQLRRDGLDWATYKACTETLAHIAIEREEFYEEILARLINQFFVSKWLGYLPSKAAGKGLSILALKNDNTATKLRTHCFKMLEKGGFAFGLYWDIIQLVQEIVIKQKGVIFQEELSVLEGILETKAGAMQNTYIITLDMIRHAAKNQTNLSFDKTLKPLLELVNNANEPLVAAIRSAAIEVIAKDKVHLSKAIELLCDEVAKGYILSYIRA